RHSIELILGPTKFDCDVPAFDEAGFVQALAEDAYTICIRTGRSAADVPDHRDARLLCARGQWPCNCSATEKPDEFPSPHGFARRGLNRVSEDYHIFGSRIVPFVAPKRDRNHVRFGSNADISPCPRDVRFTPKSGHGSARFL